MKDKVVDTIIKQCTELLSIENNVIKNKIIDPYVVYFKHKLKNLYIILVVILSVILILQITIIISIFFTYFNFIKNMKLYCK